MTKGEQRAGKFTQVIPVLLLRRTVLPKARLNGSCRDQAGDFSLLSDGVGQAVRRGALPSSRASLIV